MKPNVPYHSARLEGMITRRFYQAALPSIARRKIEILRDVPLEVYAYSGERGVPEQVASIRSFLTHAGRPKQFTVLSDGSHTAESEALLESIDQCVAVQHTSPPLPSDLPQNVQSFLTTHFTGRQLALIMSLPVNGPALYTDSDVLFFRGAREISDLAETRSVPAFYQADCVFAGDERLLRDETEKRNPANMGFLLLFKKLDWSLGLERLHLYPSVPNFFTTQTITHLSLHANGARPFDPQKFVLQLDDEFGYADHYASGALAIRHYVNPIRHKFWAAIGHQILRGSL
ncbi:MAG TPA: hypothetical protein VLK27_02910 [Chthoniobacterales bacterium]|nr:hypothetical protein [Chthoniobacterales bacterium]